LVTVACAYYQPDFIVGSRYEWGVYFGAYAGPIILPLAIWFEYWRANREER
jgi:hypothetical protein